MDIEVSMENLDFLEAFSSSTRIKIIEMLNKTPMNIKDIAFELGISSAIVTKHIQKLEAVHIVKSESIVGKRGVQKLCSIDLEQVTLKFRSTKEHGNYYTHSIPVGQYTSFSVNPTCGLVSKDKIIGIFDDPRYFADPEHTKASLLWFGSGYVEYRIPNYLLSNQAVNSLEISLEICSEAPGFREKWPSDITFYINGINVGMWTSPGEFAKYKGSSLPASKVHGTQHGLLKKVLINEEGSYIDGIRISDVAIPDLNILYGKEITFRIANHENSLNIGGVSIFGKDFGIYNQDINVSIEYKKY